MTCLGIDIGLRNLALCIMDSKDIKLWKIYNLLEEDSKCTKCQRKAKYTSDTVVYCGIHSRKLTDKIAIRNKKISSYSLHDLTIKIIKKFKEILDENSSIFDNVTSVVLELQPKINQKMKFTSHVLFTVLSQRYIDKKCSVKFERASVKLKKIKNKAAFVENTYKNRKKAATNYVMECLKEGTIDNSDEYIDMLSGVKKVDDLCDSFLLSYNNLKR